MPDDPSAAFAEPYVGPVPAAENQGDEYVVLALRWRKPPVPLYLMVRGGPQSLVEIGFDPETRLLCAVTVVAVPPDAWSTAGDGGSEVPVEEGLPRCDPGAWTARTRTDTLNRFSDHFYDVEVRTRIELRPSEVVLHLDGLAGPPARELASGRVRCGVDARGAITHVRVTELTAREAALLEENRHTPITGGFRRA
jgi:hypothetical protein